MSKLALVTIALAGALAVSACSNNQGTGAPAGGDATNAGAAGAPAAAQSAAATPEPDYPQPAVVIPPGRNPARRTVPASICRSIDVEGYMPARPMDVLKDAHVFTADHPEVASYVPCYCGCGSAGHKNNADCFVKGRDPEGRVTAWEPHGVSCAVCIDIAVDSMKMRNSGASVMAIRKKVQGDYRARFQSSETPTPPPVQGK